jgi:hypothetical protein
MNLFSVFIVICQKKGAKDGESLNIWRAVETV